MKPPDVFCIIDEQTNLAKAVKYGILSKVPEFRYSQITPNCKIIFPLVGSYYLVDFILYRSCHSQLIWK